MNNRRKLLLAFAASALAAPSLAQQKEKVWRVGVLVQQAIEPPIDQGRFGHFLKGMRDLGYIEGKNLTIELRSAGGEAQRLPSLAGELVRINLDVIVTGSTPAARALQKVTSTIPVVLLSVGDPVGSGLVRSLARPGGNVTGLSNINLHLGAKFLEMLIGFIPGLVRVAVLVNPDNANGRLLLANVQAGATKTKVTVLQADARTPTEIEQAFSMMVREKAGAVIVAQDQSLLQHRRLIAELAMKHTLPSISGSSRYTEVGVLLSYGPNLDVTYRRAATYVDKIFKGAKPADLPVEQPMTFDMVVNRKTAKALGLAIPPEIMVQATRVID